MSKLNPSRYLQLHLASFRLANTDVLDQSALYGAASTGDHDVECGLIQHVVASTGKTIGEG